MPLDLHELSALELAAAYRRRDTTPTEVVDHLLTRIERLGEHVGAFVRTTPDQARSAAAEATRALASGAELPLLYGVPTAIKDLAMTAGVPTEFGSPTMRGFVPEADDEVVARMNAAGMISLGKTTTPEFGLPCYTEPEGLPPARTPYDLTRSAGGSSGGAAAAVATRLVPLAQGSDGGGSIRIPASATGLIGVKPTRGRVSKAPVWADVAGLSTSGSLAATVRDAAALLDAISGPHPGDSVWAPLPDTSFLAACDREPGRLRVARFATPVIAEAAVDEPVLRAYEQASDLLHRLGHDVEDIELPVEPDVVTSFEVVWSVGAAMAPVPEGTEGQLRPLTRWLRDQGRARSGTDFGQALTRLQQITGAILSQLHDYDVVLTPTLAQVPSPVGGIRNDEDPAADFAAQKEFTPFTSLWNMSGMPAFSLPTGWHDGLPIGTMLAGRPAREDVLFALAAQVEATSTDWDRPPLPTDLA